MRPAVCSWRWLWCAAVVIAALASGPSAARANGRFPASNAVIFSPDGDTVMVRVTFGLLVTRDAGRWWKWICERAIGFSSLEDPSYVVTKSGAIVAGLFEGIRVSRDGGCTWESVPTPDGATVFVDVTLRPDGAVLALASSYDRRGDGGSLFKSRLYLSTDDARTFTPIGAVIDATLLAESVEVAASDPRRLYVSAVRGGDSPRHGALLVSTNAGATWVEREVRLEPKELAPFIAAVDPQRADRVYLRTSAPVERGARLLVSDDAGKTTKTLLASKGPLLGFALAPDGSTIHAGGPDDGLFVGSRDAAELSRTNALKVQCLARAGDTLWACSNEASGFVAGTSGDSGRTFADRLHLKDISGPLACPAGTNVQKECEGDFNKLRAQLGFMPEAGDPSKEPDAGARATRAAGAAPSPGPSAGPSSTVITIAITVVVGAALLLLRARARRRG